MPLLTGQKITWRSGKKTILQNLAFSLKQGRITTLIGGSGAGKTSLLKCIASIYQDYEGEIRFEGKEIREFSHQERVTHIGFVAQQFHLYPHFNLLGNCTHALIHVLKMAAPEATKKASAALSQLGLASFLQEKVVHLSGGQQQRAAIARAVVLGPKVLLLDEPTSALDPESKEQLKSLLLDLSSMGLTLLVSSHDMPFVKKIADYVIFLEHGTVIETWDSQQTPLSLCPKIERFLNTP